MKYDIFRSQDKNPDVQTKQINYKLVAKVAGIIVLVAIIVSLIFEYIYNDEFRDFFDIKILRKEISNENTMQIDISTKTNPSVYTYYRYITVLDKNVLEIYSNSTKPDYTLDIAISNPVYSDSNRFLCIAEKSGNKVYLISGQNIIWQKDVEGPINKVKINRNGYVAIATSNSGYKTIITLYNPSGEQLFKTFLPTTYLADVEISNDNKYMAIAETDATGTALQSDIKIVSIENAKTNPDEAFTNSYENGNKNPVLNLKYQNKNKITCMYSDRIVSFDDEVTEISSIESNVSFADIELNNAVLKIEKQVSGVLKADYYAHIINLDNLKESTYKLSGVPRKVYCKGDIIAINYGTEVDIINTGGWLIRRYKSLLQEIRDINLADNLVTVIYKDKVEMINL